MYKRPVRILFVHPQDGLHARQAAQWARDLGREWLESEGVVAAGGIGEALWDWPDLVIYLDSPPEHAPPWAGRTQCRIWRPDAGGDWESGVREKIRGLLGGLKLLARLDHSRAPRRPAAPD